MASIVEAGDQAFENFELVGRRGKGRPIFEQGQRGRILEIRDDPVVLGAFGVRVEETEEAVRVVTRNEIGEMVEHVVVHPGIFGAGAGFKPPEQSVQI